MKVTTRMAATIPAVTPALIEVGAEARADRALFGDVEGRRQGAGAQQHGEVVGRGCGVKLPVIWPEPPVIGCWMVGRGDHLVVENDGKALADILGGDLAEDDGAVRVEAEADHRAAGLLVEARLGVGQILAAEFDVLVRAVRAAAIGARHDVVAGRARPAPRPAPPSSSDGRDGRSSRAVLRDQLLEVLGILEARHLHQHAVGRPGAG